MSRRPTFCLFLVLLLLFCTTGATCPKVLNQYTAHAPIVFEGEPTLAEIIRTVNENTAQVRQLQATSATLTVPGAPALRTTMNYESPRRFRLIAETSLTGAELDMGSNDDLFWMWIKRNNPPATYFCRHADFERSAAREIISMEPTWLMEALGLVHFDPRDRHEGPFRRDDGRVEIRTRTMVGRAEVTKVTVLDDAYGWILEQHIYDREGRRVASAVASKHRFDLATSVSLPRHVEVELPAMKMAFSLDVTDYIVNHLDGDPDSLFSLPRRNDSQLVNLGAVQHPQGSAPPSRPQAAAARLSRPAPPTNPLREDVRETAPVGNPLREDQRRQWPAEEVAPRGGEPSVYQRSRDRAE